MLFELFDANRRIDMTLKLNTYKPLLILLFGMMFIWLKPNLAKAQDPRYLLPIESKIFFPELFNMLEARDWQKLTISIELMEPFLSSMESSMRAEYKSPLYKALARRDYEMVRSNLVKVISDGIVLTLTQLKHEQREDLIKIKLKYCLVEYLVIDNYVKTSNMDVSKKVPFGLRMNYNLISNKEKYNENSDFIIKTLRDYSNSLKI